MSSQQAVDAPGKKPTEAETAMKEMWADAAKSFETICHKSLQKGEVKSFDDLKRVIESSNKASFNTSSEQKEKWDKAKDVGLQSLKYLKLLVGVASQAATFIPMPQAAANITCSALSFVFDIPEAVKGYNDAISQVFDQVSSALSQFHIYESMETIDPKLVTQVHKVMVSFVKLCAHVVNYRQGSKLDRFRRQVKSIFEGDSDLATEMTEFKRVLQQQRDVEGTITLDNVVRTRQDIALLLEKFIVFAKTAEETQKGVQSLRDDADREKTLSKIRDALGVESNVRLDTRTTQTCTDILAKCSAGTGEWIWTHDAYRGWIAAKGRNASHVLIVSGPSSSGKTLTTALITKNLEGQKERIYVAHYFFPASIKKSDDEKSPVRRALKYMAFQIARVDGTVRKALGKLCDAGTNAFRSSASLESLWTEMKIGTSGTGATYYLVFDGVENLPPKQAEELLDFIFSPNLAEKSAGNVRVLASGTPDTFGRRLAAGTALTINMEACNELDMQIYIQEKLSGEGLLQRARPDSAQQKARDKIIERLPQKSGGSYSQLQFELDDVIRLLSTRATVEELDRILDQRMSSHEVAVKNLQRTLNSREIGELNELIRWVVFGWEYMTLSKLEAAMYLYSGTESLSSLSDIIRNKYLAVLRIEDDIVYEQSEVIEALQKERDRSGKLSHSEARTNISMTITINNVDQEICGHFFWDLAQRTIRDKFKFEFDAASNTHSNLVAITVDEFEAHHTILKRAFEFLADEPKEETKEIGSYFVCWLPDHLRRLRELEDDGKGSLDPSAQLEIGRSLYNLFKDQEVFKRHKASFEPTFWAVEDLQDVQTWLMDSAVVRRLDNKQWLQKVQRAAANPVRGFLSELVSFVVECFLRERSWEARSAFAWVEKFISADDGISQQHLNTEDNDASPPSPPLSDSQEIDWDHVSSWCQDWLGLKNSDLDSLWYERLAEAALSRSSHIGKVASLYEQALEKENPSWLCHRGSGEAYHGQNRVLDAMAQLEMALEAAGQEGAAPAPQKKDIVGLHLLLGDYAAEAADIQKAVDHYSFACDNGETDQRRQGRLGQLKARLRLQDAEEVRKWLQSIVAQDDEDGNMVTVWRLIAGDDDYDSIILGILTVAKGDPALLEGLVGALKKATESPTRGDKDQDAEMSTDERFAENEARGVLFYYRGLAASPYPERGPEDCNEALKLWEECRRLLSDIGGPKAYIVRRNATTELAKHYFHRTVDEKSQDHVDMLAQLDDPSVSTVYSDPPGFIGAAYALWGDLDKSKAALAPRIKYGLQILADDVPQNDGTGLSVIYGTMVQHGDFKNAAVAMSLLGQPDLVTGALTFDPQDLTGLEEVDADGLTPRGVHQQQLWDTLRKLANETLQVVKAQVPDTVQHIQRIEVAKGYLDSLLHPPNGTKTEAEDANDDGEARIPNGHDEDSPTRPLPTAPIACRILYDHVSLLQQAHTPELDPTSFQWSWSCDGRNPDGNRCGNVSGIDTVHYHCVYCSDRDFCADCLGRLRDPASGVRITACSPRHKWLRVPKLGSDFYVGMRAENVRIPHGVRTVGGDDKVLEILYDEGNEGEQEVVSVEAWRKKLEREWGVMEEMEMEEAEAETEPTSANPA